MNRHRQALSALLWFVTGVAVAVFAPWLFHVAADRVLFPEHRAEAMRITSPDGNVDAIAERIECGAPCSSEYAVSVVPRGAPAPRGLVQQIFLANDIVNAQVRWKEPHLLDIAYDRAFIQSFRNVTYPLGRRGDVESWRYAVEIHLSPSSTRFSYLTDGSQAKVAQ
jgi:hypothetical protein